MTLVAERLRVAFPADGTVPVVDATFQLPAGQVLALCGANGSGKTTLARAIVGLIPDLIPGTVEGRLAWQGEPLPADLGKRLGLVGYTFQDVDSQILFGTVADVLGLNERGGGGPAISEAISHFGIAPLLPAMPDRLSGGQKQVVALISALRRDPPILIFDEAVAALDPLARRRFAAWLGKLRADAKAVILIGQNPDRLVSMSDVSRWLEGGRTLPLGDRGAEPAVDDFWDNLTRCLGWGRPVRVVAEELVLRRRSSGFVVGPLDLALDFGEVIALVGPNGCGKSTLLAHLAGQLAARSGQTVLHLPDGGIPRRALTPLVKQMPYTQIIGSTVDEELGLHANSEAASAVYENFPFLRPDLDPLMLSFGQQRMLRFLAAVLSRPNLMVIDEPEQGLDATNLKHLLTFLTIARAGRKLSVALATHDLALAALVADRVLFMAEGRIIAETSTAKATDLEEWYLKQAARC